MIRQVVNVEPVSVLVIGPQSRPEFFDLMSVVAEEIETSSTTFVASLPALLDDRHLIADTADASLVIVLQTHPDQHTPAQVYDLLDHYPIARLIVCYGPWCDSDGRTRDVWPPAVRIPAALAVIRLRSELAVLRGDSEPLPLTGNRDETFLFDIGPSQLVNPHRRLLIETPDPAIRDWITSLLESVGSCTTTSVAEADAVLWDLDPWSEALSDQIRRFSNKYATVPVVGLSGFDRPHEAAAYPECGIVRVISKPAPLSEWTRQFAAALPDQSIDPEHARMARNPGL